jgi:hypothetical protein
LKGAGHQMNELVNPELWNKSVTAFVVRIRAQFWGKHNEDAHAWLYTNGFTLNYAKDMLFGLNLRSVYRSAEIWGANTGKDGNLLIPAGIVVPYLEDKKVLKLTVISMNNNSITEIFPEKNRADDTWLMSGSDHPCVIVEDFIQGYLFHQHYGKDYNVIVPSQKIPFSAPSAGINLKSHQKRYFFPAFGKETAGDDLPATLYKLGVDFRQLEPVASVGEMLQAVIAADNS